MSDSNSPPPARGTIEWARQYLTDHDAEAHVNRDSGNAVYAHDYLLAAAILYDQQPGEYDGLARKLKSRCYNLVNFKRKVVEVYYARKEDEKSSTSARTTGTGSRAFIAKPLEPWPHAVNGVALLNELASTLERYLVLPTYAAEVTALWVVHSHCYDVFDITPRLAITSPVPRCGKTKTLSLLKETTARPLSTANTTVAAVFRAIDKFQPTLLIDEADSFLRTKKGDDNEELRGILNSGHERDGAVLRVEGENHEVTAFATFGPCAIALIGKLPGTLTDRSIEIRLRRKTSNEKVERFGQQQKSSLEHLARKCARWTADNRAALEAAYAQFQFPPDVEQEIENDRALDNWRPLLAIAKVVGSFWPLFTQNALLHFERAARSTEDAGLGVELLRDLKTLFDEAAPADSLFSKDIVAALENLEDRPWKEYGRRAKPITQRQLATLLRPFLILPQTIGGTVKGYKLKDCKEVFDRYIPPNTPGTGVHASNPNGANGSDDFSDSVRMDSENGSNPNGEKDLDGETAENRKTRDEAYVEPDEEAEIERLAGVDGWQRRPDSK